VTANGKISEATRRLSDWEPWRLAELETNRSNGQVGMRLVSQTDRVRVWQICLMPGERVPFHRHQLDYFWTALTAGRSRSHYGDGSIRETAYDIGMTQHFCFEPGEAMIHDLENIGETALLFTTVEFKGGANPPLSL
jgi:hypothetical protein